MELIDRIHLDRFLTLFKRLSNSERVALSAAEDSIEKGYVDEYLDSFNPGPLVTAWELMGQNPVARQRFAKPVNIILARATDLGWVEEYRCKHTGLNKYRLSSECPGT